MGFRWHQFIAVLAVPLALASCSTGAGNECLASDESEESVMLQMRVGPPKTPKTKEQTSGKASGAESKLLQLVTNVIAGREKITDATREALDEIHDEMNNVIENAEKIHGENQNEVNRALDDIVACGTRLTEEFESESGINAVASIVDNDRSSHNTCRGNEVVLKADMDTKCGALETYANELTPPACIVSYVPALTPTNLQCIEQTAEWATSNSRIWTDMWAACNASRDLHTAKRTDCHAAQGAFESSFCSYEDKLTSACSRRTTCRTTEISKRDETHEQVATAEAAFKAEHKSAKHVQCLLDVLNATEDTDKTAMLSECLNKEIDVTHLDITYPEVPEASVCDESPVATYPCVDAWKTTEYKEKTWFSEAPPQACVQCPTAIAE